MREHLRSLPTEFNLARIANEQRQCSAHGCQSMRRGMAKYCKPHKAHSDYWGSPDGPAIRTSDYKRERAEVAALFADPVNAKHPGLLKITAYVQGLMDEAKATKGEGFHGAEELERLRIRGTKAIDIVIAGVALQHYLNRTGKGGSQRYEQFLMARAVFGLQPRERRYAQVYPPVKKTTQQSRSTRIRVTALANIGALLMEAFAKISVRASAAIETREARKAAEQAALDAPFV